VWVIGRCPFIVRVGVCRMTERRNYTRRDFNDAGLRREAADWLLLKGEPAPLTALLVCGDSDLLAGTGVRVDVQE
jgi:hypothetical protein